MTAQRIRISMSASLSRPALAECEVGHAWRHPGAKSGQPPILSMIAVVSNSSCRSTFASWASSPDVIEAPLDRLGVGGAGGLHPPQRGGQNHANGGGRRHGSAVLRPHRHEGAEARLVPCQARRDPRGGQPLEGEEDGLQDREAMAVYWLWADSRNAS